MSHVTELQFYKEGEVRKNKKGETMNWYIKVLKNYAVFSGRARRKELWYFFLFNIIVSAVLGIIDGTTGSFGIEGGGGLLTAVYALAVFIPGMAVAVRRLHDTGRSGWWGLLALIPIIGPVILVVFFMLDGKPESNQYGENPKATIEST